MNSIKMIISADWHIGAIDPKAFYNQIQSTLFRKLDEIEDGDGYIDYLIIAGDIFDSKQYFASDAVYVALNIFRNIDLYSVQGVINNVIIINGTRTHDANQLKVLHDIITSYRLFCNNDECNCYYFDTVTKYDDGDISMLIIPEEYVENQDVYYEKMFSEHYDFCFGHGMIDKIWYAKKNKEEYSANQITSAPVFELDKLTEVANYTFFGHVHTHKLYKGGKFRYLGPVTRWEFGSSSEVGMTYIEYDIDNKVIIKDEFIENKLAPIFSDRIINLMNKDDYEISEINDMIDDILAEDLANGVSRIRFIVNLNTKLANVNAIKDFLVTKIGEIPMAKLVISNDFDKDVINNMKETMELDKRTLDYIYNRNIDIEEQIKKFIKSHFSKDISVDKIKDYLKEE